MFCNQCGMQNQAAARFCNGCGSSLTAQSTIEKESAGLISNKPAQPQGLSVGQKIGILLSLILVGLVGYGVKAMVDESRRLAQSNVTSSSLPSSSLTLAKPLPSQTPLRVFAPEPTPTPMPTPYWVHERVAIVKDAIAIQPGHFFHYEFYVDPRWRKPRLVGHFEAQGGSGNDVDVFVTNDDGYTNYRNGHGCTTWYNPGRATVGTANEPMPAGNLVLVISNKDSILSHKSARIDFAIEYDYLKIP